MAHHTRGPADNADGTPGDVSLSNAQPRRCHEAGVIQSEQVVRVRLGLGCVRCGWPGPDQVPPPSPHFCHRREKRGATGQRRQLSLSLLAEAECWCDQYTVSSVQCSRGQGLVVWRAECRALPQPHRHSAPPSQPSASKLGIDEQ